MWKWEQTQGPQPQGLYSLGIRDTVWTGLICTLSPTEEQDKKIAIQQKAIQDDIVNERSEAKAQRLKAFDKYPPLKPKDSTTVALNNNTQFSNKNTTVEDTDGKTKTKTTTSVTEGPGSKSVTTTMQSKTEGS